MDTYGDVAEEVVARVAVRLGCAPHDLTLWQRGLTWHPAGLTQHIWAEATSGGFGASAWRVHIRTWCIKRVVASASQTSAIAAELAHNTVSALVRKPGSPSRLGLGVSITLSEGRVDWTARLAASIARLQVQDAVRLTTAPGILEWGAAPDVATDRLGAVVPGTALAPDPADPPDRGLLPASPVDALPFAEVAALLRAHDGVHAIATHSGVTASFPWRIECDERDFMLLEIRVGARPALGAGIAASMSLPLPSPADLLHALALNEAEMRPESPTDLVGGWVVRDTALMHECFVPDSLCTTEVIRYLAGSAARRAAWLRGSGRSIVQADSPSDAPRRVLPFRRPS